MDCLRIQLHGETTDRLKDIAMDIHNGISLIRNETHIAWSSQLAIYVLFEVDYLSFRQWSRSDQSILVE
jgi:hypothetical protein